MTNAQTLAIAAAVVAAGLIAAPSPQAQSQQEAQVTALVPRVSASTAQEYAWFVIHDEIWFCVKAECKKGAPSAR